MIRYEFAGDIQDRPDILAGDSNFSHIKKDRLVCVRSHGSSSSNTVARCHALSRIWQKALNIKAVYIIEVISERFDRLSEEEKTKTLIHELMHIPKSFGGGFIHHNMVNDRNIDKLYRMLVENERLKKDKDKISWY